MESRRRLSFSYLASLEMSHSLNQTAQVHCSLAGSQQYSCTTFVYFVPVFPKYIDYQLSLDHLFFSSRERHIAYSSSFSFPFFQVSNFQSLLLLFPAFMHVFIFLKHLFPQIRQVANTECVYVVSSPLCSC